ncbi:MAG: response regulator [Acidobacteriia bacterium]|nr:response regulator [Terriglobia bacterium]
MVSVYLDRLGYKVETADSTGEAWTRVEADPGGYVVAVLDATMPGLSMIELALQMLRASKELRIVAASGYPVDMRVLEAVAPGRVAFLPKPFAPEMLASVVRRMLGSEEEGL